LTVIVEGGRIGRSVGLKVGCAAAVFDESGTKLLMTRRTDNGQWYLPGSGMEPGESASECCLREVLQETGLRVSISRLIGIYSTPGRIVVYSDENIFQFVSLFFEATIEGGSLGLSDETTDYGFYTQAEIGGLNVMESQVERMPDAFADRQAAFFR